jgi:hypothetical protein
MMYTSHKTTVFSLLEALAPIEALVASIGFRCPHAAIEALYLIRSPTLLEALCDNHFATTTILKKVA